MPAVTRIALRFSCFVKWQPRQSGSALMRLMPSFRPIWRAFLLRGISRNVRWCRVFFQTVASLVWHSAQALAPTAFTVSFEWAGSLTNKLTTSGIGTNNPAQIVRIDGTGKWHAPNAFRVVVEVLSNDVRNGCSRQKSRLKAHVNTSLEAGFPSTAYVR